MSWNIFLILLQINSFSAQKLLENIREDYCEIYCKGACNNSSSDRTCRKDRSTFITNDYTLNLDHGHLTIEWINAYCKEWNIFAISKDTNVMLKKLSVGVFKNSTLRPGVYYLRDLGVQKVSIYNLFSQYFEIYENNLHYLNGSKYLTIVFDRFTYFINDYIHMSLNHLEGIAIFYWGPYEYSSLWMNRTILAEKTNLKFLKFNGIDFKNLTSRVFNNLKNLQTLNFTRTNVEDLSFLRSDNLQKSLLNVVLEVNQKVDMKYFEGYSRLKLIQVDKYEPHENITAIICNLNRRNCKFTLGINGIKCPAKCECQFYWGNMTLHIDCSRRGLTYVPPLPIPITGGSTTLDLRGNSLIELPNNTLSGYNDVKSLIVSSNRLTSLRVDRLPSKLNILDIRYNNIQTLDKDVIKYLSNLGDFLQCGNQWIVNCNENIFMHFLHKIYRRSLGSNLKWWADSVYLHHLNAACPDGCHCCFNRSTDYFMIDCRSAHINYYPLLAHAIPYNAILQLDTNKVEIITHSLGHDSLRELHLFDNKIADLPFHLIPKNITLLDLRKNQLEALEDQVVDFFREREESAEFEIRLSANPWKCDCSSKSFLSFLRQKEPLEYTDALDRCNIFSSGTCPEACICCLDNSTVPSMIIDCRFKGLKAIPPLPTPISGQSTLHFEGNYLEALPPNSLRGYAKLGNLYLANNRLTEINQLPENITTLDLRNNSISVLSHQMRMFFDKRRASTQLKVLLSGNPWTCNCEEKDFLHFVKSRSRYVENVTDIYCVGTGKLMILTDESDLCPSGTVHYVTLTISFMLMILIINLMIYIKQPLLIWFYEHNVCLNLAARREFDKQKKFDAFLSFTHKDEELIEEFVDRLENGDHCFRLCFYLRDWLVGVSIPECISQSVKDSKRIIILMTNNFLNSTWGRLEFRLALHATSQDRCKRLIVVLYPEVENFDDLDSELRTYMVLNTYLKRDDPNFWNKLVYSMPHVNLRHDHEPDPEAIEFSVLNRND